MHCLPFQWRAARLITAMIVLAVSIGASSKVEAQGKIDVPDAICAVASIATSTLTPKQAMCFIKFFASLLGPTPAASGRATVPAQSATMRTPDSVAEVGEMVLKCYHPTGQFEAIRVVDYPWHAQQAAWKAKNSVLLVISWRGGILGGQWATEVGLVERDGQLRAIVQQERAPFPPARNCALNNWVTMTRS